MVAAVTDGFTGTNGSPLGTTETGGKTWEALVGSWTRTGGLAVSSTAASSNPMAVVDLNTPNVDVQCNVSGSGSDCLYFRVVDSSNWLRLRNRRWQTSSTSTTYYTEYALSANTGGHTEYEYEKEASPGNFSYAWSTSSSDSYWLGQGYTANGNTRWAFSSSSTSWTTTPGSSGQTYSGCSTCSSWYYYTGNTRQGSTTNTTYYTNYSVVLEKCVAGTITTIQEFTQSDATTQLRVACQADDITIYADGAMLNTRTETAHKNGTKFGVGLGSSEYSPASALDNFAATFVAALGWGVPL